MSNKPAPTPPVTARGFSTQIGLDGGISGEKKIIGLWSKDSANMAYMESRLVSWTQSYINTLLTAQNTSVTDLTNSMQWEATNGGDDGKTQVSIDQAELQGIQSSVSASTQVASSSRDDANNKQQSLAQNDLIAAAMDPTNKVAALISTLAPAIG